MLSILQRVLEETSPVLVSARVEAEERRNNMRLREEQDAAYRAALEADQVKLSLLTLPLFYLFLVSTTQPVFFVLVEPITILCLSIWPI